MLELSENLAADCD